MARKAQPKRRLEIPEFDTLYIPPFRDFCELIKLPTSAVRWIRMLEDSLDSKLNVGHSTIAKLTSEGVSESSFIKIVNFMSPIMERLTFSPWMYRRIFQFTKLRSNYVSWYGPIEGLSMSFQERPEPHSPLMPMIHFIEARGAIQLELLPELRRLKKEYQKVNQQSAAQNWVCTEKDFYKKATLIPANVLDAGCNVMMQGGEVDELTLDQKNDVSRYSLYMYWDFYLSAIALFEEIGFHSLKNSTDKVNSSAFQSVFKKLSMNGYGDARSAFEAILEYWRDAYSIDTWSAFSKAIPITEEETPGGETSDERKKNQLNKWRRGDDYPSEDMLMKFLSRQPGNPPYTISLMAFHGIIAIGLDKLIQLSIIGQEMDGISKDKCMDILKDVFSLYPHYCAKIRNSSFYRDWQEEWDNVH